MWNLRLLFWQTQTSFIGVASNTIVLTEMRSPLVDCWMSVMLELKVRVASDLFAIWDFVALHFHDKDPLELSHVDKVDKMKPDDTFLLDCIDSEATLLGFDDDKLVSVLLAGKILPNDAERNFECAKHVTSKKASDILRFLSYIEAKADYCNRLKVSSMSSRSHHYSHLKLSTTWNR